MFKNILFFILATISTTTLHARWNDTIYSLKNQTPYTLTKFASTIGNPQVVIIGETHDSVSEHTKQMRLLNEYVKWTNVSSISLGMEFFDYTKQELVDDYIQDNVSEAEFLKNVGWGKNDFALYRNQVRFPFSNQGQCYALNFPRSLSNKIAFSGGLSALSEKEAGLLPPGFQVGGALYKKRFVEYMAVVHPEVTGKMMDDVFTAHSTWDDTMAWRISEILAQNPYQTIFVLMGKFHVEYGGGLPARLKARGVHNFITLTHYKASEGKLGDLLTRLQPDHQYGNVSDFVWIQGEPR